MKDGTGSKMMKGQSVFLAGLLIFLTSSFIALTDANAIECFTQITCSLGCTPLGSECTSCVIKIDSKGAAKANGGSDVQTRLSTQCGKIWTGTPTGSGSCASCPTKTTSGCGGLETGGPCSET